MLAQAHERAGELDQAERECRSVLDVNPGSVAAYRGLARVADQRGEHATVAACAGMVDLLDEADPEETALLKSLEGTISPAGDIDPTELPFPDELRETYQVVSLVLPELAEVFDGEQPTPLPPHHPGAAAVSRLARAFRIDEILVSIDDKVTGAVAGIGLPLRITISPALLRDAGDGVFRFWVGRALCDALTGGALLGHLDDRNLVDFGAALCGARVLSAEAQHLRKQLAKVLPRKTRKQLETISLSLEEEHWAAYRRAEEERADRAGLLLSRNPRDGIAELARRGKKSGREILGSRHLAALMRYAISDAYARSAAELWA